MIFKCDFEEFKDALIAIGKAVKKDRAMEPETQLIRLTADADEETLKVETNGNSIGVEVLLPAKVKESGSFVTSFSGVNIITLRDCDGDIVGTANDRNLILKYKNGKAKSSLPSSSIPFTDIQKPSKDTPHVLLPAEKLRDSFSKVAFIAGSGSTTDATHSIKIEISDDEEGIVKLELSACDNKSFAKAGSYCMKKGEFTGSVVVSPDRLKLLLDIFRGKDGDMELVFEENKLFAELENMKVVFAVMECKFPDLSALLQVRHKATFHSTLNRAEFAEAMKCVLYLQPEGSAMLNFTERGLSVSCLGLTEYSETIDAETTGEMSPVLFNAELLKDISTSIPGDELQIGGMNNKSPFFITYGEHDEYIYCALPRVNN